jgi:hypothetical protein
MVIIRKSDLSVQEFFRYRQSGQHGAALRSRVRAMLKPLLLAIAGVTTGLPAFASGYCFSLFDAKNKLVRQTVEPLVDMSQPITQQVATLFPGHFLVLTPASNCPEVDELTRAQDASSTGARRDPTESPIFRYAQQQELKAKITASKGLSEPTAAGQGGSGMSGPRTYSAPVSSSSSSSRSSSYGR